MKGQLRKGEEVLVSELPLCDLCKGMMGLKARYDARMVSGQWAFMCESHLALEGSGVLGVGIGQRLVTQEELDARGEADTSLANDESSLTTKG